MDEFCENQQPPQRVGSVGYSPVANTPEFRRFAKKRKGRDAILTVVICFFVALFVIGAWLFSGMLEASLFVTAIGVGIVLFTIFHPLRNNRPPVEVVAEKYDTARATIEGSTDYGVVFKDAAGHPIFFGAPEKRLLQEYYQIGDRCLHHRDIVFFEKYDKSRDTFSLCPFCKKKVELGHTRCLHCGKPMLV